MRAQVFALASGDGERCTSRGNQQRGALLPGLFYHRGTVSIWEGSEDTATSKRALTVT